MPNMASTPSAFKHSMMASTARMGKPRRILAVSRQSLLGPFLVGTAVVADLLVKRHDMSAFVALAVGLVALVATRKRSDRPENWQEEADREPEPERAALPAADEGRRQAAEEADDDESQAVHDVGLPIGRGWPRRPRRSRSPRRSPSPVRPQSRSRS